MIGAAIGYRDGNIACETAISMISRVGLMSTIIAAAVQDRIVSTPYRSLHLEIVIFDLLQHLVSYSCIYATTDDVWFQT